MSAFNALTLWWLACGAAIALELATGTIYLLMVACGLAAGALTALVGGSVAVQLVAAAVVGGGATMAWHRQRSALPRAPRSRENPDVNQDIGAAIQVPAWSADRSARVTYRGTEWTARLRGDGPALPGPHRVVAVEGNWLVLVHAASL